MPGEVRRHVRQEGRDLRDRYALDSAFHDFGFLLLLVFVLFVEFVSRLELFVS